jgi:hypothetical protein
MMRFAGAIGSARRALEIQLFVAAGETTKIGEDG